AQIPTEIPAVVAPPTDTPVPPTPTETPTPLPTETPTTVATPSPTMPFAVGQMTGVVGDRNATARVGPSTLYTPRATIPAGVNVTLLTRDNSGEWIYFCCLPSSNSPGWTRSAFLRPLGNPTLVPPREATNPNDAR